MSDFQGLMLESEGFDNGGSLEVLSLNLKVKRGQSTFQGNFNKPKYGWDIFSRYDMLIPVPTIGLHHQPLDPGP
ncbi:hypothetical protein EVAR_40072_1 [Eumeta japonica]|uniref:Uncharacterized protein n=1 Tax=Eumeta variegata TaxID=151549 RepID=A0A4C1X5F9_EUMVA|nr:hypothetical protein EVAR_40072_1 [Eumeta japonica]